MCKMKVFKRFLTALLVVVLLLSASAPAAMAAVKARIISSTNVYNVPSTSGKSIRVPKGLTVSVTAYKGNWARVSYQGRTAYIPLPYLNLVNRLTAYTAKSTPVYKNPSTSSKKLGTLSIATPVYVVGRAGNFYRIQNASGSVTGYVSASHLTSKAKISAAYNAYKKTQAATKKPAASSKKNTASSAAARLNAVITPLYGKPYSSSASVGSAPGAFNCSTFVNYVMGKFGFPMKSTAKEQALDNRYAKITSLSSLRAGDILCFDGDKDGECDHTAIYLGNGKFAEASRNAGKVHENTFSPYYTEHFMWARRPG